MREIIRETDRANIGKPIFAGLFLTSEKFFSDIECFLSIGISSQTRLVVSSVRQLHQEACRPGRKPQELGFWGVVLITSQCFPSRAGPGCPPQTW